MSSVGAEDISTSLQAALNEVDIIESMLDQYELNKDKKILADVTSRMKAIAADLRDLSSNPSSKTKENSPMLQQLSSKMKTLVTRTKALANPDDPSLKSPNNTNSGSANNNNTGGSTSRRTSTASMNKKPILLKGWLRKQGEDVFKAWKKRFFVQSGTSLAYFASETDSEPLGQIDLSQITSVQAVNKTDFDLITPRRTYRLQIVSKSAGDESELLDYWTQSIQQWLLFWKNEEQFKIQKEKEMELQLKALKEKEIREKEEKQLQVQQQQLQQQQLLKQKQELEKKMQEEERLQQLESQKKLEEEQEKERQVQAAKKAEEDERLKKEREEEEKERQRKEKALREEYERKQEEESKRKLMEEEEERQRLFFQKQKKELERKVQEELEKQHQQQQQQQQQQYTQSSQTETSNSEAGAKVEKEPQNTSRPHSHSLSRAENVPAKQSSGDSDSNSATVVHETNKPSNNIHVNSGTLEPHSSKTEQHGTVIQVKPASSTEHLQSAPIQAHSTEDNLKIDVSQFESKSKEELIQILVHKSQQQETMNLLFIKLQEELKLKEKQYEIVRGKQKFDAESKKVAEEKLELLKTELKKKEEEMNAKDKHIKQISKKLKQARKDWITKDTQVSNVSSSLSTSPPASHHSFSSYQSLSNNNNTGITQSNSSGNINTSSKSSWQLNPEIDSLQRQIKQLKEAIWAHQQQNSTLANEIEHSKKEHQIALKVKDDQIRSLEKELAFAKQTHQELREKYLAQQLGLLDPHDKSLLAELQRVTKEYFFSLALSCKLNMRTDCNINTYSLYEKALSENVHWTKWIDWVPTQISEASSKKL